MGQRFNICISCSANLSSNKEERLLEGVFCLFRGQFTRIVELMVIDLSNYIAAPLSEDCSLADAIIAIRDVENRRLSIYGASETGAINAVSITKTIHATEVVISLPFHEVASINNTELEKFWRRVWESLTSFGILLLAAGDELELGDGSPAEQTIILLDKFSLACWVIVSTKVAVGVSLPKTGTYEVLLKTSDYVMFVSKHLKQRLSP